jgi:AcrR family transcriptional regulator
VAAAAPSPARRRARQAAAAPPAEASTRERVLQVARELIAERGNAAITLVDVAARAGLSRQTMYLLFGSRAGLLVAMVEQIDATSAGPERLRAARDGSDPLAAFEAYLRAWFDYLPQVLPVARALTAAATAGDRDAQAAWESRMRKLRGGFLQLAQALRAAGRLRETWSTQAAADWMFGLTHADLWQHLVVEAGWPGATAVDRLVSALRATLIKP